ncbi:MAG TPA: ABC transporter ATP-binding protein [Candidatus Rifleibacterium sp.]|nr:ABC transporter ATP-binding protein [Candidatus Rifleibacterium sp.]HPT44364.1 ABC transporter ATP-binding protein [Candidatus Rifleibacterium sp.]
MSAIEFAEVCKTWVQPDEQSRVAALCQLNLKVDQGEVFALAGLNGAGKTTAIKILLGACHADSGSARILDGLDSLSSLHSLGFAPEEPDLPAFLTVEELLTAACGLSGMPLTTGRLDRALELFSLDSERRRQVGDLSKGTRQRVSLAAAVVHQPKLVIFDEPASGLDPLGRQLVKNVIRQLNSEGATVFFTTHILSDLPGLCSRIGVLHRGKLLFAGTPAEFCQSDALPALEERFSSMVSVAGA